MEVSQCRTLGEELRKGPWPTLGLERIGFTDPGGARGVSVACGFIGGDPCASTSMCFVLRHGGYDSGGGLRGQGQNQNQSTSSPLPLSLLRNDVH